MALILSLVIGGVVGWLTTSLTHAEAQQGVLLNVISGIVGAFIAGFLVAGDLIGPYLLTLHTIAISFTGAVILLALVNIVRSSSFRWFGAKG